MSRQGRGLLCFGHAKRGSGARYLFVRGSVDGFALILGARLADFSNPGAGRVERYIFGKRVLGFAGNAIKLTLAKVFHLVFPLGLLAIRSNGR